MVRISISQHIKLIHSRKESLSSIPLRKPFTHQIYFIGVTNIFNIYTFFIIPEALAWSKKVFGKLSCNTSLVSESITISKDSNSGYSYFSLFWILAI
jgi:hypothetical protein